MAILRTAHLSCAACGERRGDRGVADIAIPAANTLVANLRAAHHGGESPALRLTRNFCNRGLEQPTAAELTLLLFCLSRREAGYGWS